MPWKLMENSASIYGFLNLIGAVLGPVAGCMIANFYLVHRRVINLDQLYFDPKSNTKNTLYSGLNKPAYAATIISVIISISGQFIPAFSSLSSVSWFIGFFSSALLYVLFKRLSSGGDMDRFPEEGEA
jgi:allantoin permease